jgi:hypothetical protein
MVFPELQKFIDVSMPWFQVHTEGALSLTTSLLHMASSIIEDPKHRHQPSGVAVGPTNVAISCSYVVDSQSNTARCLRYEYSLLQSLINPFY